MCVLIYHVYFCGLSGAGFFVFFLFFFFTYLIFRSKWHLVKEKTCLYKQRNSVLTVFNWILYISRQYCIKTVSNIYILVCFACFSIVRRDLVSFFTCEFSCYLIPSSINPYLRYIDTKSNMHMRSIWLGLALGQGLLFGCYLLHQWQYMHRYTLPPVLTPCHVVLPVSSC